MVGELLVILALVLINGLFSGAEIAIISLRKTRLQELLSQKRRGARAVEALRQNPERFLATVQIGITVVSATAGAFGGASLAQELAPYLSFLGAYAYDASFALVVALISYLSLVLGELVPKSLALRSAERYSLLIGPFLRGLSRLIRPFVWFLTASSNLVLRMFGDRTGFTETRLSRDELGHLVEEAARSGVLHPHTGEIASRALTLQDLTIVDLMLPRDRIDALPRNATPQEIRALLLKQPHSRFPVYEGAVDNVIGYVTLKDLLGLILGGEPAPLTAVMRKAYFVPETARALDVLRDLQRRRTQLAIVVDEHGVTTGLATVEDLVEELIGDVAHEYEPPVELIKPEGEGKFLVQGIAPVREVNRLLGTALPEGEDWSTLGGLCMALAGAIPQPGATFSTEDKTTLEVVDATPRRVKTVRVRPARRR